MYTEAGLGRKIPPPLAHQNPAHLPYHRSKQESAVDVDDSTLMMMMRMRRGVEGVSKSN